MDEDAKKDIARFRFGVISDLVGQRKLSRGEKQRILDDKSQAERAIPRSSRTRISRSTILHWLRRWEDGWGRHVANMPRPPLPVPFKTIRKESPLIQEIVRKR